MGSTDGLRERKKQQTRLRVADAALVLFDERGFEHVTVAEVARAAEVSQATVFNYFPTKEDLVYRGMQAYLDTLLDAVRGRPAGVSVPDAFCDVALRPGGTLDDPDPAAGARLTAVARVIAASRTLQARAQTVYERATRDLADLITADLGVGGDDIRPWVAANALMGINRAMTEAVHRHARSGGLTAELAARVTAEGERAFDLLRGGLAGYAPAPR